MAGSFRDKAPDHAGQFFLVAVEALNRGVEHQFGIKLFEIERMACVVGQHGKESQLGTAVAFAERVNHVQLRQEMRRLS
jgi:hypothetical protein